MASKTWEFRLDGIRHKVELERGYFSNKLSVQVDGRPLPIALTESRRTHDLGGKHAFQIDNHPCALVVMPRGFNVEYDLEIDGVSVTTGQSNDLEEIRLRQFKIGAPFIIAVALILGWVNWHLLHTKGYYYDELAYFTPMFIFLPIYFMFFPKDLLGQYHRKFSARMWVVIIIFILLGFANSYALRHGLY